MSSRLDAHPSASRNSRGLCTGMRDRSRVRCGSADQRVDARHARQANQIFVAHGVGMSSPPNSPAVIDADWPAIRVGK